MGEKDRIINLKDSEDPFVKNLTALLTTSCRHRSQEIAENAEDDLRKEVRMMSIESVEIAEVIRIVMLVGDGTPSDPMRKMVQYWGKSGDLIAERKGIDDIKMPGPFSER